MIFFNYLMFAFIIIAGISLWYKIQYHLNQKNMESQHRALFFFNKYFSIAFLLPVIQRQSSNGIAEKRSQKRANVALIIFYIDIIIGLIVSTFTK